MKSVEISQRIVAALLWDAPALRASRDEGQLEFVNAMQGRSVEAPNELSGDLDALVLAAKAVHARFSGRDSDAQLAARLLAEREDPSESLLGRMLRCWFGGAEPEHWQTTIQLVEAVADRGLRARLFTKLFVYSYDEGEAGLAESLFFKALDASDGALKSQLRVLATNLYGRSYTFTGEPYEGDEVVDLPWVADSALAAIDTLLKDLSADATRSLGTTSERFGTTPVWRLWIAEGQATWAGALWQRDSLRSQIASSLVLEGMNDHESAREAVGLWAASGRQGVQSVVDAAEPRFRVETADQILTADLKIESHTRRGRPRYVNAALALWDLVSDEVGLQLLDELPASTSEDPTEVRVRQLWARLGLRISDDWVERFAVLNKDAQAKVAGNFAPGAVAGLSEEALDAALRALAPSRSMDNVAFTRVAAARLGRAYEPAPEEWNEASTTEVLDLIEHDPELVPDTAVKSAVSKLLEHVRHDVRKGRMGSYSFGGSEPRAELGRIAGLSGMNVPDAVDVLMEAAMAHDTNSRPRLGALQGLLHLARGGRLDEASISPLRYIPIDTGSGDPFTSVDPDLLRVYRSSTLAFVQGPDEELSRLLVLVRSKDATARLVAVRTIGDLADQLQRNTVAAAVAGALHDPEPTVVAQAIAASPIEILTDSVWRETIVARLFTLFYSGRRVVRVQIARLIRQLRGRSMGPEFERMESSATSDKSWQVRSVLEDVQ